MLGRTDAWIDTPSINLPRTKRTVALGCYAKYLLSASTAFYKLLKLLETHLNLQLQHSRILLTAGTSPALAQHACRLSTQTYG